jgi:hypothetical protein
MKDGSKNKYQESNEVEVDRDDIIADPFIVQVQSLNTRVVC